MVRVGDLKQAAVEQWLPRAGAFAIPLAVLPNTFDRFILPKLLLARLTLIVLAGLYLARQWRDGQLTWKRSPLDIPLLAYLGSATLSTIFAVNQNVALSGTYFRYEGLLTLLTYAGLFWIAVQLISGPQDAIAISRSLLAAGYVVSLIVIWQWLSAAPIDVFRPCSVVRPYATFGNAIPLSMFVAMLLPLAISEFISAAAWPSRLLAFNALVVMSLALLFGFTRSAWIGAAVGTLLVLGSQRSVLRTRPALVVGLIAFVGLGAMVAAVPARGGWSMGQCTAQRVATILQPTTGGVAVRPHIWADTLSLIGSRPLVGYGPDTFGLVYPRFQTGDWIQGRLIDKAHSDILQVAATQGVLGLLTYVWLFTAFLAAFWRGRRTPLGWGMLGGWVAYQVAMQANFSWLPSSVPAWLLAAAAISTFASPLPGRALALIPPPLRGRAGWGVRWAVIATAATALIAVGVVRPYAADVRFMAGVQAIASGHRTAACAAVDQARALGPEQSAYAVEAGHLAMDLRSDGRPGPGAEWSVARNDFRGAIRLGTGDPSAWRGLAVADSALGRKAESLAVARGALDLDRYDPASRTLLEALNAGT